MKWFLLIPCCNHRFFFTSLIVIREAFSTSAYILKLISLVFCCTPNNKNRCVSDSFAYLWDSLPPAGLTCLASISGFMSSFISSCYAIFNCYHWDAWFFLKGNEGAVNLEDRRGSEEVVGWEKWSELSQLGCILWKKNEEKEKNKEDIWS